MDKWNEEAAPNLNLITEEVQSSNLLSKKQSHEFSEELSDGGERNENLKMLYKGKKK